MKDTSHIFFLRYILYIYGQYMIGWGGRILPARFIHLEDKTNSTIQEKKGPSKSTQSTKY